MYIILYNDNNLIESVLVYLKRLKIPSLDRTQV